jgi:SAM-dependent methyltransferase
MINRPYEYRLMAMVEDVHWWYRFLHMKCFEVLTQNFSNSKIKILDAGCGTGGLMGYLKNHGYQYIEGFDLSEEAVTFSLNRGLTVWQHDLRYLNIYLGSRYYDVIFSCDTIYFLSEDEMSLFFKNCNLLLNHGGILVVNFPTIKAFSGIHDIAVGIRQRYLYSEIVALIDPNKFEIIKYQHWPFIFSPLILFARFFQRMTLIMKPISKIESDLKLLHKWVNWFLFLICRFEQKFISNVAPIGSSVFLVLKKK